MTTSELARVIAFDIVIVAVWTLLVGATAPRWPRRWLDRDTGLLVLRGFDSPATYRRLRVPAWAARLPEAGAAFGGKSKRALPGRTPDEIADYLVEVRRAEWVHWASMLCVLPVGVLSPWWITALFAAVIVAVNLTFIVILRHNRVRLTSILRRGVPRA